MAGLLTPLVIRFLEKFVVQSQEGTATSFKASLSGSRGFELHNLELDLSSILPARDLIECQRAFARSLRIKIPWTSLNTQPIEIIFDTLEIILSDKLDQKSEGDSDAEVDASSEAPRSSNRGSGGSGGGWLDNWLGSNLQSLALRAGLNLSFTIKNLVIKYIHQSEFSLTLALEQLQIANSDAEEWTELVDAPEAWLMKNCLLKGLSASLDHADVTQHTFMPLLRLNSVNISALLPIFSYIEDIDLGEDGAKVAVQVELGTVQSAVNDQQIRWINDLIAGINDARVAAEPVSLPESPHQAAVAAAGDSLVDFSSTPRGGQMRALGVFSKIWDMAVDEVEYLKQLEEPQEEQQLQVLINDDDDDDVATGGRQAPTEAELTVIVKSLRIQLGVATRSTLLSGPSALPFLEAEFGLTQIHTASIGTDMQDSEVQLEKVAVRHNAAHIDLITEVLENRVDKMFLRSGEPGWDDIFELSACDVPLRSPGSLRSPRNAFEAKLSSDVDDRDRYVCAVHAGKVWICPTPSIHRQHLELFLERLHLENKPGVLVVNEEEAQQQDNNANDTSFSSIIGWEVAIDALEVVLRCKSRPDAALILRAVQPISYLTHLGKTSGDAAAPSGLYCALVLAVSDTSCSSNNRSSNTAIDEERESAAVSTTIVLSGCLKAEDGGDVPFFSVSPFNVECSGQQIVVVIQACVAATAAPGGVSESIETSSFLKDAAKKVLFTFADDGIRIIKRIDTGVERYEVLAGKVGVALQGVVGDDDGGSRNISSNSITAAVELTRVRCTTSATDGVSLSIGLVSIDVNRDEEGSSSQSSLLPPPPLALLSSFRMHSKASYNEFSFVSLNIAAVPCVMEAAMATLAAFQNKGAAAAVGTTSPPPPLHPPSTTSVSHTVTTSTTCLRFDIITFTLFPAVTGIAASNLAVAMGLSGWLSSFSAEVGPDSRTLALGSVEVSLCRLRLDTYQHVDIAPEKVLRFSRKVGDSIIKASSVVVPGTAKESAPHEHFSLEVAPTVVRLTPEFLTTIGALTPPKNPTTIITHDNTSRAVLNQSNSVDGGGAAADGRPLLHGKVSFEGVAVEVTAAVLWALQNESNTFTDVLSPDLVISLDQAFILFHQNPVSERRPWLAGVSGVASTANASLLGITAQILGHAGSAGAESTRILLPADVHVSNYTWQLTGSSVTTVEAQVLDVKASHAVVDAMRTLETAYRLKNTEETSMKQQDERVARADNYYYFSGTDDLRSGAFTLVRPGNIADLLPLEISLLDQSAELGGGFVMNFRYPYSRNIDCIFFEGITDMQTADSVLARFDDATGEFVPVEITALHQTSFEKGATVGTCVFPAAVSGAPDISHQTWRLELRGSALEEIPIEKFLQRVYINPGNEAFWRPTSTDDNGAVTNPPPRPLVALTTLAFSIGHLDLSLIAPIAANQSASSEGISEAHTLNTLAVLHCDSAVGRLSLWDGEPQSVAVDIAVSVSCEYTEARTLCGFTLIEPFEIDFCYEVGGGHNKAKMNSQHEGTTTIISQSTTLLRGDEELLGIQQKDFGSLAARPEPKGIGLEVTLSLLSPLVLNISDLATHDLRQLMSVAASFGEEASGSSAAAPSTAGPIQVHNWIDTDLVVRQYGTSTFETLVSASSTSDFFFPLPPCLGGILGMQFAFADESPSYTESVDVMTVGADAVSVASKTCMRNLAIEVNNDSDGIWHVHVRDGARIVNSQSTSLHILLTKPSGSHFLMEVPAGKSRDVPLFTPNTKMRLWLGGKGIWSTEFDMLQQQSESVEIIEADLSFQADLVPEMNCCSNNAVILLVESLGAAAISGHLTHTVWTPLTLTNNLPLPLLLLSPDSNDKYETVGSSTSVPISIEGVGGDVGHLRLHASTSSPESDVVLFSPPINEEVSLFSMNARTPPPGRNVVFLPSPGESDVVTLSSAKDTCLPCVLFTEEDNESPGLSLQLFAQTAVINELPLPVTLKIPGCAPIFVPAKGTVAADMSSSYPGNLAVFCATYATRTYTSSGFSIDGDQQLVLPFSCPDNEDKSVVAFGVEVQRRQIGTATATELTISPGCYLSNLTNLPLRMRGIGVVRAEEEKLEEDSILLLAPNSSVPLAAFPELVELAAVHNEIDDNASYEWQTLTFSTKLSEKQEGKVYLNVSGEHFTLSYSTDEETTYTSLIFFRDEFPAVVVKNRSAVLLEVSWSDHDERICLELPSQQLLELDVSSAHEVIDNEVADDFLASYSKSRSHRPRIRETIHFRTHGQDEAWFELSLLPGDPVRFGQLFIAVLERSGGLDVIVEEGPPHLLERSMLPSKYSIQMQQLCIVFKDDERGRITGRPSPQPRKLVSLTINSLLATFSRTASAASCDRIRLRLIFEELDCATHFPFEKTLLWSSLDLPQTFASELEVLLPPPGTGEGVVAIKNALLTLPLMFLDIDDSSYEMFTQCRVLMQPPTSSSEVLATTTTKNSVLEKAREAVLGKQIYIENFFVSEINALADIHLSAKTMGGSVPLDTDRSPLSISSIKAHDVSLPPDVLLRALKDHALAEALLNAPLVLGSLELFFNPTGLVRSIRRGVANMIDLPMQGLQQGPLQFISGVGQGSASFLKEISGWSVSSVVGFSRAAGNLASSLVRGGSPALQQAPLPSDADAQNISTLIYGFARFPTLLPRDLYLPVGEVLVMSDANEVIIYQGAKTHFMFTLSLPVIVFTSNAALFFSNMGHTPSLLVWLQPEASVSIADTSLEIHSPHATPFTNLNSVDSVTVVSKFHSVQWAKLSPIFRRMNLTK